MPITCQVFFMSLRICILETDILRPELVDQYQGY
ncbi:MAG: amidotransferase, partial [Pseudomonas mandelii]